MSLCIFTVVARNYLPMALTLATSVRQHHPEAELRIYVADGLEGLPAFATEWQSVLVGLDTVLDASFEPLRFQYNITEFCTSVKPHLFLHLLRETDAEHLFYLDPDTWLFGRLDPITATAPEAALWLTPHLLHPQLDGQHAYPEYKHLWEGIFNLGFCAVRRCAQAEQFLRWWDTRLRDHCYADVFDGLHTDQKWMDYAPAYLGESLCILRHPGVNAAHWNLDERRLAEHGADQFQIDGQPLLLFHFSGFDFQGPWLTRHAPPESQQAYMTDAVRALATRYRSAVTQLGYAAHIKLPYRYNFFDNGDQVTPLHRRLYRAQGGGSYCPKPFKAAGRLHTALHKARLLDNGAAAQRAHAAATLPGIGRLTRLAHQVLRLFLRIAGASRYAYLLKFFNKFARPESHAFLLAESALTDAPRR